MGIGRIYFLKYEAVGEEFRERQLGVSVNSPQYESPMKDTFLTCTVYCKHSKIRILKLETSILNLSSCILKLKIEILS